MGFSVSGAAAIVFVAGFIAFGMFHTAAANSYERVTDAEAARTDSALEQANTVIEVAGATYDADAETLTVAVDNNGTAQLRLSATDLLVDGTYQTGWEGSATVSGDGQTDLWLSGDRVRITLDAVGSQPARVKVVTASGVAGTAEVTQA